MTSDTQEGRNKLWELIGQYDVAMLTTRDGSVLRSRPMYLYPDRANDSLWFFISVDDHAVREIAASDDVNVTIASQEESNYVSLSGNAEIVHDREKMAQLWLPAISDWYTHLKVDAPDTRLLRVRLVQGQYWDEEAGRMSRIWEMARAGLAGEEPDLVETGKVSLSQPQKPASGGGA